MRGVTGHFTRVKLASSTAVLDLHSKHRYGRYSYSCMGQVLAASLALLLIGLSFHNKELIDWKFRKAELNVPIIEDGMEHGLGGLLPMHSLGPNVSYIPGSRGDSIFPPSLI